MLGSPLVFTYNDPNSLELGSIFKITESSPRKGICGVSLYNLESPNLNLPNVILTLLVYSNVVIPKLPEAKTRLEVESITIMATNSSNTIGILTYTLQYQNPILSEEPTIKTQVPTTSSFVNSASGIFANYLKGNVITTYNGNNRSINIFSSKESST